MSIDDDLAALAELCGILPRFYDLQGGERVTSPETQRAMLSANGIDVSCDDAIRHAMWQVRHEREDRWFPAEIIVESGMPAPLNFGLGASWQLVDDDTGARAAEGTPADHITLPPLPPGVYVMTAEASGRVEQVTVIAAPSRLPNLMTAAGTDRMWGLNFALYGLTSARSTGQGDFEDLARAAEIAGGAGASFVGINPIHAMGYANSEAISPYSPSHRGFLNPGYIALDRVAGLEHGPDLSAFDGPRRAPNVAHAEHLSAQYAALETAFETFKSRAAPGAQAEFYAYLVAAREEAKDFARYEARSELLGPDWIVWPEDAPEAAPERVAYHLWLQWVAETQLADAQARAKGAGMALGLYLDLAVGPRRNGAEAYCERSAIAQGISLGAPPDHLSPEGQDWDLAAFSPRKLAAQHYAPLRRIMGQTMRHAGVIRIDHVLGLNRSFWLPDDGSPGGYIRQPFEALLAIIKIEAVRHGCVVIGEDLGLVPEGFRETMRGHGFYGYSVLQYERDADGNFRDPADSEGQVLSCFATHDTPTVRGFETGHDIDWWERLGWIGAGAARDQHTARALDVAQVSEGADFAMRVHGRLAASNAELVTVQLDDVLDTVEAQNLPGTIDAHPNWRRKYSVPVDELAQDDRLGAIAKQMADAGRSATRKENSDED